MNALERRRGVYELGERAVTYYLDTGLCVFCDADDVAGKPHGDHCTVGKVAGVAVTPERAKEKARQRGIVDRALTRESRCTNRSCSKPFMHDDECDFDLAPEDGF